MRQYKNGSAQKFPENAKVMLRELLVLVTCGALTGATKSPHADYVEQMIKSGSFKVDPRHVDDILRDASLDVVSVKHYRYL